MLEWEHSFAKVADVAKSLLENKRRVRGVHIHPHGAFCGVLLGPNLTIATLTLALTYRDLHYHQNPMVYSVATSLSNEFCQNRLSCFFRNPANKRTNKQKTNADENITFLADITTGPYKVANWLHPGSGLISDAQTAHRMDSETESEKHNRYIESNFIAICSQLLGQFRSQAHTETQTHINSFIGANKNPRDLKTNPPKLSCSFLTSNLYCI